MVDVYCFTSKTQTNLWAGYGARKWAVSDCSENQMEARMTKALDFPVGVAAARKSGPC